MPGKSTSDAKRSAAALLDRARSGDQAAIAQLQLAASPEGWRRGNRNAAIDAWNAYTPGTEGDLKNVNTSHGFLGDAGEVIGKGLKFAAPLAGLIPGVGPLVGAGLAAGGSALGGALNHDKFSLLDTALAGGAGYLGGKANPFGSKIPSAPNLAGMGDATYKVAGAGGTPGIAGGGGILGGLVDGGAKGGGFLEKALQYAPLALGAASNANRQHESDQMMRDAVAGANRDYAGRAPLRDAAQAGILALPGLERPDLSHIFADPSNPYNKVRPLTTRYTQ